MANVIIASKGVWDLTNHVVQWALLQGRVWLQSDFMIPIISFLAPEAAWNLPAFFFNLCPSSSPSLSVFSLFPLFPLSLFPFPPSLFPSLFLSQSLFSPSFLPPPLLSFEKGEAGAKDSFSGVEMTTWCLCCKYYKNTHQTKLINFNSVTIHQESRMFCFSCSENTLLNFLLFQL